MNSIFLITEENVNDQTLAAALGMGRGARGSVLPGQLTEWGTSCCCLCSFGCKVLGKIKRVTHAARKDFVL